MKISKKKAYELAFKNGTTPVKNKEVTHNEAELQSCSKRDEARALLRLKKQIEKAQSMIEQ